MADVAVDLELDDDERNDVQPRLDTEDTIAAIASTRGGLRGIVRLSGPQAANCLQSCTDVGDLSGLNGARRRSGSVFAGDLFGELPCDIYFWPHGKSYTRQASVEIHFSGAAPLLDAVLDQVCRAGSRLARPGEFTLRAFLGGRLDLTQAEAVLGVIDAENPGELDLALQQLAGGIASPLRSIRETLLNLVADIEAGLDFVEEDIEFVTAESMKTQIRSCRQQVQSLLAQIRSRVDRRTFVRVVLVGDPNAGKSSLFNALLGESHALVAEVAGTTRDYVTSRVDWNDVPIELIDTAGIDREGVGIDDAAQTQRESIVAGADLRLECRPATDATDAVVDGSSDVEILVVTKSDLLSPPDGSEFRGPLAFTSSETGQGIAELRRRIVETACKMLRCPILEGTAFRCHDSLQGVAEALEHAIVAAEQSLGDEIVAAELRIAIDSLATIVGAVYTDDILDRLFSRFCIGK